MFKWWKKKERSEDEPNEEGQEPTKKARLQSEALEPRILLSATWVDAEAMSALIVGS